MYPDCSKSASNVKEYLPEIKLLIQINDVARIESLLSWIISLANAKSLFKIHFGHKIFICEPIFKVFAAHITTNLVPHAAEKMFFFFFSPSKYDINYLRKLILKSQNQNNKCVMNGMVLELFGP